MSTASPAAWTITVRCAGCGAELEVEPDRSIVDCEFCDATSVIDLGGVATCFRLTTGLDEEETRAAARRALRQHGLSDAVADLTVEPEVLLPFWRIESPSGDRSALALDRADLTLLPDVTLPAGQLERINLDRSQATATAVVEPTVPLPAMARRFGADPSSVKASLIYAPFRRCTYSRAGLAYEMLIDTATGSIHAFIWPRVHDPKLDRRLGSLLALALALFTAVALFVPGLMLSVVVMLVVAVPLWWVLERSIVTSREAS